MEFIFENQITYKRSRWKRLRIIFLLKIKNLMHNNHLVWKENSIKLGFVIVKFSKSKHNYVWWGKLVLIYSKIRMNNYSPLLIFRTQYSQPQIDRIRKRPNCYHNWPFSFFKPKKQWWSTRKFQSLRNFSGPKPFEMHQILMKLNFWISNDLEFGINFNHIHNDDEHTGNCALRFGVHRTLYYIL